MAVLVAALATLATPACAAPPGFASDEALFEVVKVAVAYQGAASVLALATQCGRSPAWRDYDREAVLTDYRTARDYLETHAPGHRINAEFQVFRLLQSLNDVGGSLNYEARDAAQLRVCAGVVPALLGKYQRASMK